MLTITDADLALAATLGLLLEKLPESAKDYTDAADPRATRMPESWWVRDARGRAIGSLRFTPVDCLYATQFAAGVTGPEETVADALRRIAPVVRHVRTGEHDGTETITTPSGKTFERPRAITLCGAAPTGPDLQPIAARVELRDGRVNEMCLECRAKLEATGVHDLSRLPGRSGSSTAKQRDFLRRLLDEGARAGRPFLLDARGIDQMSSREASAKIDELKTLKAKGWKS